MEPTNSSQPPVDSYDLTIQSPESSTQKQPVAPEQEATSQVAQEAIQKADTEAQGGLDNQVTKKKGPIDKSMQSLAVRMGIADKGAKKTSAEIRGYMKLLPNTSPIQLPDGVSFNWKQEEFKIESGGRQLEAMKFTSTADLPEEERQTIVLTTGSHRSLEFYAFPMIQSLTDMGHDVVVYNPSGFGNSEGKASAENLLEDGVAVYDHVSKEIQTDSSKIKFMGYSLGGAVAAHVGNEREVDVILDRTFTSTADAANAFLKDMSIPKPLRRIAQKTMSKHANLEVETKLESLKGRVMIVHGKQDKVLGPLGTKLAVKAQDLFKNQPKKYVTLQVDSTHEHDELSFSARKSAPGDSSKEYEKSLATNAKTQQGTLWYSEAPLEQFQNQRATLADFLRGQQES